MSLSQFPKKSTLQAAHKFVANAKTLRLAALNEEQLARLITESEKHIERLFAEAEEILNRPTKASAA